MSQTNLLTRSSLDHYLNLKYPVTLYPDEEGGYTAEIKELRGCLTQGETVSEAMENIEDARVLWIETAYEHGDDIPLPATEVAYSGKFLLRMLPSLHRKLAEGAKREDVSLNQYIGSLLSQENTSRQNILTFQQILERLKTMKMQGTKQEKNIVLPEELTDISDGTEITVEIPENQILTQEERRKQLNKLIEEWKDDFEMDEILAKIDKRRDKESDK